MSVFCRLCLCYTCQIIFDAPNLSERFYLSKLPKVESTETTSVCILSVPESAPVRMKMTMATVKSSLVARAKEHGIVFDKLVFTFFQTNIFQGVALCYAVTTPFLLQTDDSRSHNTYPFSRNVEW